MVTALEVPLVSFLGMQLFQSKIVIECICGPHPYPYLIRDKFKELQSRGFIDYHVPHITAAAAFLLHTSGRKEPNRAVPERGVVVVGCGVSGWVGCQVHSGSIRLSFCR